MFFFLHVFVPSPVSECWLYYAVHDRSMEVLLGILFIFFSLSCFTLFYRQLVGSKCGAAAVRCDDDAQSHAIEVSETIENLCLLRCIIFSSFHQWPAIDFIRNKKKTSFSVVEFDDSC